MHIRTIFASALAFVPLISSHGGGFHYTIDGVTYPGAYRTIYDSSIGSIQRYWVWDGLNYPNDTDLACNRPGTPASKSLSAPTTAGSVVSVNYTIPAGGWTFGHPIGPMLAYMARCPDVGCDDVDLRAPMWFKIWEKGLVSGTWADGYWAMRDVFTDFKNLDITVPKSLKPGKYLFRHEMVNLQTGPVQFFPNCVQLDVRGEGNSLPKESELVAFPGAYEKDRGLSFPHSERGHKEPDGRDSPSDAVWLYVLHGNDTSPYPMPGPPVWQS
ncbi:glycoside hydrolase [Polyplosphaeria fusca]|uniref:AA9 family lytic polysaccharide monooxygenase n=1 Tax=Polyplosphaeria fusca TaxID=682080 RepID=A0A9P4R1P8_9PLEO|nr:glycoside hydrolase [Polyplosphaeria fusca]